MIPEETWRDLLGRIAASTAAYVLLTAVTGVLGTLPGVLPLVGLVVSLAVNVAYGPVRAALWRRRQRRRIE